MAMQTYDAGRLSRLWDSRWAFLGDWRNRWEEMAFYIMPQQRSFTSHHNVGNRRQEQLIFDSTALEANERLATRMHEALTSPASPWFNLEFSDPELNQVDEAKEWLEECEKRIRLALQNSNFDMMIGQFYLDLGAFGTGMMSCDEAPPPYEGAPGFQGLTFMHLHMEGVGLAENAAGTIDEVFWRFKMTAEQLVQKYGADAPRRALAQYEEGKLDLTTEMLICRFPRFIENPPKDPTKLLPTERPYAEVWVNYSDREITEDTGTYEQSVFVGRWRRKSEDYMGYGPGERALPTVRTVNEAERLELAAWAKVIDPPIKTEMNNIVGDVDIRSAGITVVRSLDKSTEWDVKPDLEHHMIQLEDKRFQIRDIFKYHQLELPPREQVGQMTAYEVAQRSNQVYRALGSTLVQLQSDLLDPMIQRVFGIMYRKGALPELPEALADAELNVQYVGPMALAAKASEIEAIDRFIMDTVAIVTQTGNPAPLDIIDFDKMQRYKAELLGVPAVALRSAEEVEEMREQQQQAAKAQQAGDAAVQMSEVAKNVGAGVGQERALEVLEGGMGGNA